MTTLTDLCDDVYTITNRPDLVAETQLAVRAATLKLHQSDFYFRDIFETSIQFDAEDFKQQFDVSSVVPLFRALKYIRRYDPTGTGAAANFYEILSATNLLDSYKQDRVNVAYAAGAYVNINSSVKLQYALLGVYVNPNVTPANFSSWIADNHPFAIVFEAARLLFKQIGFDEMSATFDKLATEQLVEVRMANIQAVGY